MNKKSPKVLLVYPPNQLMDIEIPRPDGSLGPLYLAGALRNLQVEVEILDASVGTKEDTLKETFLKRVKQDNGLTRIGMTPDRLRKHFADGHYDIVGINSNFTPQTKMALEIAKIAKEINKETLVIAGGINARSLPERFFAGGCVDLIALTESEKIIVEIVNAWKEGLGFNNVPGVIYKSGNKLNMNPVRPDLISTNLDDLPFPAWDLLPFEKYDEINSPHGSITPGKSRRYAPIMTSRGCPFKCAYCHISEEKSPQSITGDIGSLRLKSIDRVMQEVEILRSLGVNHLFMEDDSLLAKKSRVIDLFKRLASLGMKISDVNGVNLVHLSVPSSDGRLKPDKEYLEIIKESGFDEIVFPVESANQRILDKYATGKLNHERQDVLELVRVAVEVGITCPINMMIGFPDETEFEILQSVELAKKLIGAGVPYVTFFIPIPFPGSKLYQQAISGNHLSSDFDPDMMNWKNSVMKNTAVPPERIVELRDWAWDSVNSDHYKRARIEREIRTRFALDNK